MQKLKRLLLVPLSWLAAIIFLIEESHLGLDRGAHGKTGRDASGSRHRITDYRIAATHGRLVAFLLPA